MTISKEDRAAMARAEGAQMRLHPFDEVIRSVDGLIKQGVDVYQQFRCSSCCAKQTMGDKNTFFMQGHCEECDQITDIRATGMNFMAVASTQRAVRAMQIYVLTGKPGGD